MPTWITYLLYFILGGTLVTGVKVLSTRPNSGWLIGILIAMPVITTLSYLVLIIDGSQFGKANFTEARTAIKSNLLVGLPGFGAFLLTLYFLLAMSKTRTHGILSVTASAIVCTLVVLVGSRLLTLFLLATACSRPNRRNSA